MIARGTLISALLVVELAIVGEAIVAVGGGPPISLARPAFFDSAPAEAAPDARLVEGGEHRIFDAGARPALTVDVGYADLTIETGSPSQIDVSVSASSDFGIFRSTAPITAHENGDKLRISTTKESGLSMGDDRMVTVLVPPETQVTVVSAGDIKAVGLRAESSFNSVGSGSVTVDDYDAPALHVAASNGRIVLQRIVATRLDATSSNGRVEGSALQVRDGSIESDGRVTLGFATGADTLVSAQASNGKISLSGFSGAPAAVTAPKSDDDDDDSSSQTVRVGGGDGHLDVRSSDGNIHLAQEG